MPTSTTVFFNTHTKPAASRLSFFLKPHEWREPAGNAIYKTIGPTAEAAGKDTEADLATLLKLIVILAVLGVIGLTGYAYLGDLSPDQQDVVQPVTLDAD